MLATCRRAAQLLGNTTLTQPPDLFELPSADLDGGPQPSSPSLRRRSLGHSLTVATSAAAAGAATPNPDGVQASAGSHGALLSPGALGAAAAGAAAGVVGSASPGSGAGADDDEQNQPFGPLFLAMETVLCTVDDWRFDAFRLAEATAGHPMSALGFWLIKRAGLMDVLQLDAQALARFLRKIEDSYPDNPYHNKTHAADVLQARGRSGVLRLVTVGKQVSQWCTSHSCGGGVLTLPEGRALTVLCDAAAARRACTCS